MIRPKGFFAASIIALAISGASATGFNAINSGSSTYQRAVEFAQAQPSNIPKIMPSEDPSDDNQIPQSRFIIAWVLGADCIINRIGKTPRDPWSSLRKKIGGAEWTRVWNVHRQDDEVIAIIIKTPEAPWEIAPLLTAVKKHSLIYSVEDGSDYFSITNIFRGQGAG